LSQGEKLVIYIKKNPAVRGRKNPISYFSRIKNPKLPYLHVVAALQAYSYVLLLKYFKLLKNHYFLY
jgi:hypothetical protein